MYKCPCCCQGKPNKSIILLQGANSLAWVLLDRKEAVFLLRLHNVWDVWGRNQGLLVAGPAGQIGQQLVSYDEWICLAHIQIHIVGIGFMGFCFVCYDFLQSVERVIVHFFLWNLVIVDFFDVSIVLIGPDWFCDTLMCLWFLWFCSGNGLLWWAFQASFSWKKSGARISAEGHPWSCNSVDF